jgi:malate dehydrogenase (oxaloacetate-decarboxylating)
MNYNELALELHRKHKGKIEVTSKVPLETQEDLSISYTPGVAEPCRKIAANKEEVYTYTSKGNMVAVVTDGSAVLGLGNIGPEAALPVMEGKAILFKQFAGVDAFPICLNTQDTEEIIRIVKTLEPGFGGINLEDISSPRCFEIEERLKKEMNIPVFHDDQHGTAVVVLAGLMNALKVVEKNISTVKIVIAGAGAAATAIAKLLIKAGAKNIILCDSKGVLSSSRTELDDHKKSLLEFSNPQDVSGDLKSAMKGADVFIGVSTANVITRDEVKIMAVKPIVFAMSNPNPEISPEEAKAGGAFVVATGRSDFPNQLNNVLVFPGIFKGALSIRSQITEEMKMAAAKALAGMVGDPTPEKIIPHPLEPEVADVVAQAVVKVAITPTQKGR